MSQFEFIFVLISIIAGLALAQLLAGMTRPPKDPNGRLDVAHVAFSFGVTVLLITIWWSTFRWQTYEPWTVIEFLLLCFYISLFYVKAVILSPLRASELPSFDEIRGKFFAVMILYCAVEPVVIYLRDGELAPWWYLPMMVHFGVLAGLGIYLRKAWFDRLYALWFCIVNIAWIFLARFTG
ncbi:hypothetical protein F3N42_04750 [Marinihelvus fidelis]|uniref:Uncharacterized protein n=1 Tax=Marinihelvus fidelis TaxID=2613842 RepID=A0A5N0TF83_9GAMM|nr:hypothetical protein [Marinihelvus fidelis]KAA9132536.1 hypothetical protein F3N42_04750 [Marinihelvus fidelis]